MEENKKKKSSGMWLFLLILVGAVGLFLYEGYFRDNAKNNQNIVKSDVEVGTVYEYSEEEIQDFLVKAEQRLEDDKRYGLEPGYDIDTWKKYGGKNLPEGFFADEAEGATRTTYDSYYHLLEKNSEVYEGNFNNMEDRLPSQIKYKVNKLKATDTFNDDLSLKIADAFYGYSSVGDPWFPLVKYPDSNDYSIYEIYKPSSAKEYVKGYWDNLIKFKAEVEALDKKYKDADTSLMDLMGDVNFEAAGKTYGDGECYGGCTLFKDIYRKFTSDNSMNPLQTYLMGQFKWNYDDPDGLLTLLDGIETNIKDGLLDYFPDEYNYFTDHDHYFFYYYPTRVEKIDERTYLVDIETTDVANRYAIEQIYYNICGNFLKRYRDMTTDLTLYEDYFKKMDIIIRINNTDMNKGMVLDYSMGSVLYPELSTSTEDFPTSKISDTHLRSYMNMDPAGIPWYPNEEAQNLLKIYFTYAREAYDNNSYFSFVETIKTAADEVSMNIDDAEKIVYSYYLLCNYIH